MNEEYQIKKKEEVAQILFKNNVSINEAKTIGSFIEELQQENQELKKSLKASRRVAKHHLNMELDLEVQQKELIEWLEEMIKDLFRNEEYETGSIYGYILSKYKEIIGDKDE